MGNSIDMWKEVYSPLREQKLINKAVGMMASPPPLAPRLKLLDGSVQATVKPEMWRGTEFEEEREFVSDISDPSSNDDDDEGGGDGGGSDGRRDGKEVEEDGGGGDGGSGGDDDGKQGCSTGEEEGLKGEEVFQKELDWVGVVGRDKRRVGEKGGKRKKVGGENICKLQLRMLQNKTVSKKKHRKI